MKKNCVLLLLISMGIAYGNDNQSKTDIIHNEVALQTQAVYNIKQDAHPTLYTMVLTLCAKALVAMPKDIVVYKSEYTETHAGVAQTKNYPINAFFYGNDLFICHDILTALSYEGIQGILALALAERIVDKNGKLNRTYLGTGIGLTLADLLYQTYEYRTVDKQGVHYWDFNRHNFSWKRIFSTWGMAFLVARAHSNYLQKKIDFKAARIVGRPCVINAIKELSKLQEGQVAVTGKRLAALKKRQKMFNTLFYWVRGFTDQERVAYLQRTGRKQ